MREFINEAINREENSIATAELQKLRQYLLIQDSLFTRVSGLINK